jgi:hypothetical protein
MYWRILDPAGPPSEPLSTYLLPQISPFPSLNEMPLLRSRGLLLSGGGGGGGGKEDADATNKTTTKSLPLPPGLDAIECELERNVKDSLSSLVLFKNSPDA